MRNMSETGMKIIVSPIDFLHTADSAQIMADCGHPSWIAPSGLQQVLSPLFKTTTVCMRCVPRKELIQLLTGAGTKSLPGSRAELEAELGVEETERIYREFNVTEFDGRID